MSKYGQSSVQSRGGHAKRGFAILLPVLAAEVPQEEFSLDENVVTARRIPVSCRNAAARDGDYR
jgi:hypothetical protein